MMFGPSDIKTDAKLDAELLGLPPTIQDFETGPEFQLEAQDQRRKKKDTQVHSFTHTKVFY